MRKISNNKGFTIIEVVLVLAIAAVIFLIVFLAVPALQRNNRNNGRNNDAAKVAAAVHECLSNRNGIVTNCDAVAEVGAIGTTIQFNKLDSYSFGAAAYSLTDARVVYGNQCTAGGNAATPGGGTRAFAVTYRIEPAIDRCIAN